MIRRPPRSTLSYTTLFRSLIGLPIAALILWLMGAAGKLWWLWAWAAWMGFNRSEEHTSELQSRGHLVCRLLLEKKKKKKTKKEKKNTARHHITHTDNI